ncbi:MAG: hypothetical protein JWP31_1812 [Aeromicrobium sp.]|nr:hypothetical protein [Aeromicrobium sp.]
MTRILAIDPGSTESGWVIIDANTRRPLQFGKSPNAMVLDHCYGDLVWDVAVIEMIASYGMAVGAEVFETCVWIGRYLEAVVSVRNGDEPQLVKRHPVKMHHCHSARAKDSNVTQALVDRFASGQTNHGKGTRVNPGWFHGFAKDVWQAYALAVYIADTRVGATL